MHVERVAGSGTLLLSSNDLMSAMVVVAGTIEIGDLSLRRGESCILPAALAAVRLQLDRAEAIITRMEPPS